LAKAYPADRRVLDWAKRCLPEPARQEHRQWSFVWEGGLKATSEPSPWWDLGLRWLEDHREAPDWHFVWKEVRQAETEEIRARATQLGCELLDRYPQLVPWSFVLQDLLDLPRPLPPGESVQTLVRRALGWLPGREDRPGWSHIWERVLAVSSLSSEPGSQGKVLGLGLRWLQGREDEPGWSFVWEALAERQELELTEGDQGALVAAGATWLQTQLSTAAKGYSHVLGKVLDLNGGLLIEEAIEGWLGRYLHHPAWPMIATKALLNVPKHPRAPRWQSQLVAALETAPFRNIWNQIERLIEESGRRAADGSLSVDLTPSLAALRRRPRDLEAQLRRLGSYIGSGRVFLAQATKAGPNPFFLVDGVWANVRMPPDSANQVELGDQLEVVLESVNAKQRLVIARLAGQEYLDAPAAKKRQARPPDDTVQPGKVESGLITGAQRYGVFVSFRGFVGLLHRSRLPADQDPESNYQRGQELRVRVVAITEKGIDLELA
jgi:hypothetical protein